MDNVICHFKSSVSKSSIFSMFIKSHVVKFMSQYCLESDHVTLVLHLS